MLILDIIVKSRRFSIHLPNTLTYFLRFKAKIYQTLDLLHIIIHFSKNIIVNNYFKSYTNSKL